MSKVEIIISTPSQVSQDFASAWLRAEGGDPDIVPAIGFGLPSELFAARAQMPVPRGWGCKAAEI